MVYNNDRNMYNIYHDIGDEVSNLASSLCYKKKEDVKYAKTNRFLY